MRGGKLVPALCNVLGTLILLSVILTCVPVAAPRILGYEVYNVVSGSMEPSIPVGSLIYVEAAVPAEIQEGEVIAYHSNGSTVTHRVVSNRLVEGEYITKGDANQEEDLNTVPYTCLVGRVKYHVPFAGQFLAIYTSRVGKLYVICFALCGAMFNMLAGRLRSRAREGIEAAAGKEGKQDAKGSGTEGSGKNGDKAE